VYLSSQNKSNIGLSPTLREDPSDSLTQFPHQDISIKHSHGDR